MYGCTATRQNKYKKIVVRDETEQAAHRGAPDDCHIVLQSACSNRAMWGALVENSDNLERHYEYCKENPVRCFK